MTKSEIIEKLKPRCNGYDLPLSLNIALVAEILTEPCVGENDVLHIVSFSDEGVEVCDTEYDDFDTKDDLYAAGYDGDM